ncbi:CCA tRNA nucleotidyltransferase [Alkalilacustris brevis]|uniref:CCA tRNA nucleotidyltransferase n=1 Tax=Alkalilacustris brevis TaxID=2026338 RepID=UPI000E0CDE1A|nr:CCA tRNA nucleotidyltransferase [Alkalilacustris brevis]
MKIRGTWIDAPGTRAVCAMLARAGHRALFVGGCVRNALLHQPVNDVDIATDARPERVLELAEGAGLRGVATGIDHGTVTIVADGVGHEVTTFRRDVETFGRRAVVAYSSDVAEDAARRDFTMNALYADPTGEVIDPLGEGLADLAERRVRFVGRAEARITEDYLRILRFFRFHAWYGDPDAGPDPEGLAACAAQVDGIVTLSRERVGAEMRRLLAAPDPAPSVAAMEASGVLAQVLPGTTARALPVLVHLEGDAPAAYSRRLAVLAAPAQGGADAVARTLRLPRDDARHLARLLDEAGRTRGPAELGYRHGALAAADMVLVRAALHETPPPPGWQRDIARGAEARFPVAAADLMPALQGPALGERLRQLEDRWIASDFTLTREELLA